MSVSVSMKITGSRNAGDMWKTVLVGLLVKYAYISILEASSY